MNKNNDRWSALSMKDRAALIDIYVKSGITDLGEIRKDYNSFDNGGNIESVVDEEDVEENVPNYNNAYTLSRDTGDYMKNWYSQRQNIGLNSFYNKVVDEYNTKYEYDLIIPKVKAPVGTNNKVGEYVVAPGSNGIVTKNPFYYEKDLELAKDYLKDFNRRSGNFKIKFDNTSRYAGRYDPNEGNLIHISTKVPNDARLNYAVHEATHSLTNRDFNFDSDYLGHLPEDNTYYFGNPSEQYARVMQLRNYLNLDPNKVYTEDEVNKIREDIEFKYPNTREHLGDNLLFIYSNKEIADMLNNSFDDGGGLDTPTTEEPIYYDDTYIEPARIKAFDSQEDYNRYLGEKGARIVREGTNKVAQNIFKGLEYTPIISDGIDLANAVAATQQGNFKKAGVIAGAALLPNIVEKPVKAISKGVRNLNTYRKYVKDTERFRNSVNFALKGYEKNYDVLQRNVPNKLNSIEEAKFTSSFTPISTKPNLFKMRVGGHYDLGKQEVWLNAYNPSYLKDAIKSPKKAIRRLQGVATHEGNHMALDHLNDVTAIKGKGYFDPIPTHPMNATTNHIFNNPNRNVKKWQRVPEEFVSEMNYVRNGTGNAPGSSIYSWKDSHIKRAERYLSNRFKLTPEETREAVKSLEALGYSDGGYLDTNSFELPLSLDTYNNYVENSKTTVVPEAPIDTNEIRRRQAWAESSGNDKNISSAGAKGRYQIMPATLKEYQDTTGDIGDIFNPVYNRKVRDYEFNRYVNSETLNMGNPTDSVKMGRRLAAYNYGLTNTRRAIHKADSLGLERNNSFEWLEALPKETKDYINFILRNKDVGGNKTNYAYKNRKN